MNAKSFLTTLFLVVGLLFGQGVFASVEAESQTQIIASDGTVYRFDSEKEAISLVSGEMIVVTPSKCEVTKQFGLYIEKTCQMAEVIKAVEAGLVYQPSVTKVTKRLRTELILPILSIASVVIVVFSVWFAGRHNDNQFIKPYLAATAFLATAAAIANAAFFLVVTSVAVPRFWTALVGVIVALIVAFKIFSVICSIHGKFDDKVKKVIFVAAAIHIVCMLLPLYLMW